MEETYAETRREFIAFWGEMAGSWGISKTMAQIYALLFSRTRPLDTDQIMTELGISRGNANMNLHKLLDWGLVNKVERPDTRKDFFQAETDVWKMTLRIIQQRQERELKPVTTKLNELAERLSVGETEAAALPPQGETPTDDRIVFRERLLQMVEFMQLFHQFTSMILPLLQAQNPNALAELMMSLDDYVNPEEE